MHDIHKGYHKIFFDNGFPVYTAGNTLDVRFAERFYNILKNFRYSTSSIIGSYTYYSVEMGIPFFLHGREPTLINKCDSNIASGEYIYATHKYRYVSKLFNKHIEHVTHEQKEFVHLHLGLYDGLSRKKMFIVLVSALFNIFFVKFAAMLVVNKCKKMLKKMIHAEKKNSV